MGSATVYKVLGECIAYKEKGKSESEQWKTR